MNERPDLPVDLFDFDLPEELIALRPAVPRSSARLLVSEERELTDSTVDALSQFLRAGDLLIFNDTKVIPARLSGTRSRGESTVDVEATLMERLGPDSWRALARPGKRLRVGDTIAFDECSAVVRDKLQDGAIVLRFDRSGAALDALVSSSGAMPLPPYIAARRPADSRDRDDYQTVLAARDGAVAAPTAALHFDEALLASLAARGILHTTVTLHVGAGTFLPVKSETTGGHVMHSESGEIDAATADRINATREAGGRAICVGTTSLRVLETAADDGGSLRPWSGATDIFISPGYRFKAADALMTNFHLPRSTLIMLVAAFVGMERMRAIYAHAVANRYRFYSYGDSSLLFPHR